MHHYTPHIDLLRDHHTLRPDHGRLQEDRTSIRDRQRLIYLLSQWISMAVLGPEHHLNNTAAHRKDLYRPRPCLPVDDRFLRKWTRMCPK